MAACNDHAILRDDSLARCAISDEEAKKRFDALEMTASTQPSPSMRGNKLRGCTSNAFASFHIVARVTERPASIRW
jgi:hypothetical protein